MRIGPCLRCLQWWESCALCGLSRALEVSSAREVGVVDRIDNKGRGDDAATEEAAIEASDRFQSTIGFLELDANLALGAVAL